MKPAKRRFAVAVTALLIAGEVLFAGGGVVFAQTTTDILDVPTVEEVLVSDEVTEDIPVPIISTDGDITSGAPDEETPVEVALSTDDAGGTDLQGASSTPQLQETFSDQQTIPLAEASSTVDVILATTTDEIIPDPLPPLEDEGATTTTEEVVVEEVAPVVEHEVVPLEETPPPPPQVEQEQAPIVLSAKELRPESKYMFSFSGKKISTSRRVGRTRMERSQRVTSVVSEVVDVAPTVAVNNTTGVMSVSGACEDKYYVILVYKHEEDYAQDPGSYVVNRSFPCENGSFTYGVTNLPPSLPDGNYYLLVGSMGETTPWVPITSITEVTLARSH